MSEADFDYFISRADSIIKNHPIAYTHTRNAKLCKCGVLDIFLRVEKEFVSETAFSGSLSIPTQVMANDVCCMVQGKKAIDAIKINFTKELGYQPDVVYQKCFYNFIVRTLVILLKEIIDESSYIDTNAKD